MGKVEDIFLEVLEVVIACIFGGGLGALIGYALNGVVGAIAGFLIGAPLSYVADNRR